MSKTGWTICGAAALLLSLPCHASDPPHIEHADIADSTLELRFDQPMLTWTGSPDLMGISIDPPADCLWIWNDDTNLACSLGWTGRFRPATTYRVAIHAGLWSQAGVALPPQDLKLESRRPEVSADWRVRWKEGIPQIGLETTVEVSAAALRKVLHLQAGDHEVEYILAAEQARPSVDAGVQSGTKWRVLPQPASNDEAWLSLRVEPGLQATTGDLAGQQSEVLLTALANERFRVRRVGCSDSSPGTLSQQNIEVTGGAVVDLRCAAGEKVLLEFSSRLSAESLQWLQAHLPAGLSLARRPASERVAAGYSSGRDYRRDGYVLTLQGNDAGRRIELPLPGSLRAEQGEALAAPVAIAIQTTDFVAQLHVEPPRLVVPPGSATPTYLNWINYSSIHVNQTALGGGQLIGSSQNVAGQGTNHFEHKPVPPAGSDVQRHGGLVQGNATPAGAPAYYNFNFNLAYADFNITANWTGNQVLAWVTDWDGAKPLPGTRVELLRTRQDEVDVLASGTTDADGIVVLTNPTDAPDLAGTRVLRATRGRARSIVPLDERVPVEKEESPESYSSPVDDGARMAWGISDRPLYRAGDTVHYRLWLRQRDGNHLRRLAEAAPLLVRLAPRFNNTGLFDVPATPDRYGSVSGELRLPANLRDNDYCLSLVVDKQTVENAACFRVTGYHVNELWAELHSASTALVNGGNLVLDASAGYFSGGAAAGAKLEFQNVLSSVRVDDAYPQFASYQFVDPYEEVGGPDSESFTDAFPARLDLDAQGRAHVDTVLHAPAHEDGKGIVFGNLEISAVASTSPSSVVTSAPVSVKFSRYPRLVGLKVDPWSLRTDADPQVSAIVITAAGAAVDAARVSIDVDEMPSDQGTETPPVLAHCEIESGHAAPCAFRPPHTGVYRFRASSPDAAGSTITRYAYVEGSPFNAPRQQASISLTAGTRQVVGDGSLDLVLQQPYARATVLVSVENGRSLKHWLLHAEGTELKFAVPLEAQWAPGVTVRTIVLDAADAAFGRHARPGAVLRAASIELAITPSPTATVGITVDRAQARPGETVNLRVSNASAQHRQVTLAVVDDAARALVPDMVAASNPLDNPRWLGALKKWNDTGWFGLGIWPRPIDHEAASSQRLFDFRSSSDSEHLESIVVTGSRITAADLFVRAVPSDHSLGRLPGYGGQAVAALRSRFVESAMWKSDLDLAPGAEASLPLALPDNLTRWRVLVWSADDADQFSLAEATVEASLPIEVRSETPTRLFPGDTARIAVSVRNHADSASVIAARLDAAGAGVTAGSRWSASLAPNAQKDISFLARPVREGELAVQARAVAATGSDGIAASVEVASPLVHQHLPVAGWLPAQGVHLKLPPLPAGATPTALRVQASRGLLGLARAWVESLRDYPHRCWEQILSRAVGAAAARKLGIESSWPQGREAIDEALRVASQFQDHNGQMHFFVGGGELSELGASPFLTAYTLRAFSFLREQGYALPEDVESRAREGMVQWLGNLRVPTAGSPNQPYWEEVLAVASALGPEQAIRGEMLDRLIETSDKMSFAADADLAVLLAARPSHAPKAAKLLEVLRTAARRHGMSRTIESSVATPWPFVSRTLDQCVALEAFSKLDSSADAAELQTAMQRGFVDLYAGGTRSIDTQSAARCLMVLARLPSAVASMNAPVQVQVSTAGPSGSIVLAPQQGSAEWRSPVTTLPATLDLHGTAGSEALIGFAANIDYTIDGRRAAAAAVGFGLQRRYSVLRDHAWKDIPAGAVRAGDWVRVELALDSSATRRYVAISDTVAGGLRPADLALSGVAGVDVRRLSDSGSPYFSERKVDDRYARFYCDELPPGHHEIFYYARATHDGHYTAMPAVAELMYGPATVARTAATSIEIAPGGE